MATLHTHHSHNSLPPVRVEIRKVSTAAPFQWLTQGFNDLKTAPVASLLYGFIFAAIGMLITVLSIHYPTFAIAMISGFLLVGPFVSIGLYDMSRQIEEGMYPSLKHAITQLSFNTISLVSFAFILAFILAFWARITATISAVFFGELALAQESWTALLSSESNSVAFFTTFILAGLVLAVLVFSISVVAIPMITHKKVDVMTAITTSLQVVMANPIAMLVWAALIVAVIGLGMMAFYIGLIFALPIVGHASWHAYRALVSD